tara:strand:- start:698 stop:877 length:180 start_codon:yes stop_codon:yes gene_type:complete
VVLEKALKHQNQILLIKIQKAKDQLKEMPQQVEELKFQKQMKLLYNKRQMTLIKDIKIN